MSSISSIIAACFSGSSFEDQDSAQIYTIRVNNSALTFTKLKKIEATALTLNLGFETFLTCEIYDTETVFGISPDEFDVSQNSDVRESYDSRRFLAGRIFFLFYRQNIFRLLASFNFYKIRIGADR